MLVWSNFNGYLWYYFSLWFDFDCVLDWHGMFRRLLCISGGGLCLCCNIFGGWKNYVEKVVSFLYFISLGDNKLYSWILSHIRGEKASGREMFYPWYGYINSINEAFSYIKERSLCLFHLKELKDGILSIPKTVLFSFNSFEFFRGAIENKKCLF